MILKKLERLLETSGIISGSSKIKKINKFWGFGREIVKSLPFLLYNYIVLKELS